MTHRLEHTRKRRRSARATNAVSVVVAMVAAVVVAGAVLVGTAPPATAAAPSPSPSAPAPSTPATSAPAVAPSGVPASSGPVGIQVGPALPTSSAPGSGTAVDGGSSQGGCGLLDVTCHVEHAIDGWFSDVVTSALNPTLSLLSHTLLATPDLTGEGRVGQLWEMSVGIADSLLVLFVLAGGAIVMGHETVQSRTAAKDIAPRLVVAVVAANASLSLAGEAIAVANALAQAVLGGGADAAHASGAISDLVLGALTGGGIFLVLVGGVVAVLALMLLATFVVRLALLVLLTVAAPLMLVCHALPQTEGVARVWWRAFFGCLLVQVAQALVLVTAVRVFLETGGNATLGIASSGGLVDLLVSAALFWVLLKIPSWVSRAVFTSGGHRGAVAQVTRSVVIYKAARAIGTAVAA